MYDTPAEMWGFFYEWKFTMHADLFRSILIGTCQIKCNSKRASDQDFSPGCAIDIILFGIEI